MKNLFIIVALSIIFVSCKLCNSNNNRNSIIEFPIYNIQQDCMISAGKYYVNQNIVIQNRCIITIMPNVKLMFEEDCGILCFGCIKAAGTSENPIYFMSKNRRWTNVRIINSKETESNFMHCIFMNGSGATSYYKLNDNSTKNINADNIQKYGGAFICENSKKIIFEDCVFRDCQATYTGGLSCLNTSLELKNCNFYNTISTESIGAIEIRESNFEITSCNISNNSADYCGGIGIYFSKGNLNHCTVSNNISFKRHAAMLLSNSNVKLCNCTISNNKSFGGIFIQNYETDFKTIIENCTIADNYSKSEGGGINCAGNIIVQNCSILDNTSEIVGGGCAFLEWGPVKVIDSKINGNHSKHDGGGLYYAFIKNKSLIERCTITDNICDKYGGGLSSHGSKLELKDCMIIDNKAMQKGGGIHLDNSVSQFKEKLCNFDNSEIIKNKPDNIYNGN